MVYLFGKKCWFLQLEYKQVRIGVESEQSNLFSDFKMSQNGLCEVTELEVRTVFILTVY